jgi:hypothetical protein
MEMQDIMSQKQLAAVSEMVALAVKRGRESTVSTTAIDALSAKSSGNTGGKP